MRKLTIEQTEALFGLTDTETVKALYQLLSNLVENQERATLSVRAEDVVVLQLHKARLEGAKLLVSQFTAYMSELHRRGSDV